MAKYVALLRGVNVGGKNKVSMTALKNAFSDHGLTNVKTYINSGNILFDSELDENKIQALCEQIIKQSFSVEIPVFIIQSKKLLQAISAAPDWWGKEPHAKHNAIFVLPPKTGAEIAAEVGNTNEEYEQVATYGNVIFWSAPLKTFAKTKWAKIAQNKEIYNLLTIRNANTTLKLREIILLRS